MCERFRLKRPWKEILDFYEVGDAGAALHAGERHNIAPADRIPVVRRVDGKRQLALLDWTADRAIAPAETIGDASAFKAGRRCLIAMDGFYEWSAGADGKSSRLPWLFTFRPGERLFSAAGIWETRQSASGLVETVTLITSGANEVVALVRERMPVIIHRMRYARWLDPKLTQADALAMCVPYNEPHNMQAWRVDTRINDIGFRGAPERIES